MTATSSAAGAQDPAPAIMVGQLVDQSGAPVGDAVISAYLQKEAPDGYSIALVPLASAETDASGAFSLAGALTESVPQNPDGSVSLEIDVESENAGGKTFTVEAVPPGNGTDTWTWGETADPSIVGSPTSSLLSDLDNSALDDVVLSMEGASSIATLRRAEQAAWRNTQSKSSKSSESARKLGEVSLKTCKSSPFWGYTWVATKNDKGELNEKDTFAPIQKIDTGIRLVARYKWLSTYNTRLQVGYTVDGGKSYGAGMAHLRENATTTEMHERFGHNFHGDYETQFRYREYEKFCVDPANTVPSDGVFWASTGKKKWIPRKWLVNPRKNLRYSMYYCDPRFPVSNMPAKLSVAKASTSTLSGRASIAGIALDAAQTNSESHKLTFVRKSLGAKACGNDNTVDSASLVREVD